MLQEFRNTFDFVMEKESNEENEKPSRLALFALEIIKALLAAGADVNAVNEKGETPLFALLRGAFFAYECYESSEGWYLDERRADMQLLWKELVKSGARANVIAFIDDYDLLTCAHFAAKFADVDLLSTYADHGGDIDVRSARFSTPLQLAYGITFFDRRCAKSFQTLLDYGAHVDVVDSNGYDVHDEVMKSFKAGAKFLAFSE